MSMTNSPSHRFSGAFDGSTLYDPEYSVEISKQMRVPEKISVNPGADTFESRDRFSLSHNQNQRQSNLSDHNWMRVPERILVVGGDKHAAGREPLPEMKLESSFLGDPVKDSPIQLATPPRTLTLDDPLYPTDDPENDLNSFQNSKANKTNNRKVNQNYFSPSQEMNSFSHENGSPPSSFYNGFYNSNNSMTGGDDQVAFKRQIKTLSRRISALERDNSQRYQREVIVYSFGVIYLVLKGLFWLNRRW